MRSATAADFKDILADNPAVIVDFHAPWCQPCKALEPHLAAIDGKPIPVVKVDIDAEPGLAGAYAIRSVPTLVVFRNGEAVDVKVGAVSQTALRNWVAQHAA